jgi:hypothetical protein
MNRGNSESFPPSSANATESPFAILPEAEVEAPASPFTWGARSHWPFKEEDAPEEFGFEAPRNPGVASQPVTSPQSVSPFSAASWPRESRVEPLKAKEDPAFSSFESQAPRDLRSEAASVNVPAVHETAASVSAVAAARPELRAETASEFPSDSHAIRQLELKAIFGLEHEVDAFELLELCRALPRVKTLARIRSEDVVTIEALKSLLANLGFGSGALKLQIGSAPLDFIREGQVILAVQTDGGFAPGVRETLIVAARELGRMA